MNTATVLKQDRANFEAHLFRLMFEDGFGFDEALAHSRDYARCVFKKATPTAVLRVEQTLRRLETENTQH